MLAHDIKGIVYICSHWTELDDRIRVGTKVNPDKLHMDIVPRELYENYPINISPKLGKRVVSLLKAAGLPDAEEDPEADWHDDNTTPSHWMFPDGTPPATSISLNARYNPVFHVKVGQALRDLRKEGILIVGSGSIVHNLFRANWLPFISGVLRGTWNTLQPDYKPEKWALEFERAVRDTIMSNSVCPYLLIGSVCCNAKLMPLVGSSSRRCTGTLDGESLL